MNPELQRNLILELSPRRLTWALVAVGLVCVAALMAVSLGDGAAFGRRVSALAALGFVGGWLFLGACLIWGARQAGSAIVTEVGERTWDFQRMSALTPWSMTWGKLVGATSLAWLVGLIGIGLALLNGLTGAFPVQALQLAVAALAAAVLLQAASMAAALVAVRKARVEGRLATLRNRRSAVAGIAVLIFAVNGAVRGWMAMHGARAGQPLGGADIVWWGLSFTWGALLLLSALLFAAWAVVGAWRLMRLELQSENSLWLWAGFVLCCGLYLAGFADLGRVAGEAEAARYGTLAKALSAGGVFAVICYLAAFAEPADRQRMGSFRRALAERRLDLAALTAPLVTAPLLLAIVAWGVIAVSAPDRFDGGRGVGRDINLAMVGLAVLLYLVRDLGVIAYVRFSPRPKRGDASAVLALVLLYLVGGVIAPALGGGVGLALVSPFGRPTTLAVIAGGAEAVLAWWLAAGRIFGRPATGKDAAASLPAR